MKSVYEYKIARKRVSQVEEPKVAGPADIHDFLRTLPFAEEDQEHFITVMLDTKHRVRAYTTVTIGLVDRSQVHAREVFRAAIIAGAASVILAHNHPSGDPTPSAQDITCTRQLVEAGKIIGIEVLDHIVLGDSEAPKPFISLREAKIM